MTPTDSQAARLHEELARVLALLEKATPGPWRWWTSCSYNRLSSDATGRDGDVLRAVRYRDGACGIEGSETDMEALISAINFLRKHGAHIAETFKETPNG
jgi:hypothetical protein